MSGSTFTVRLLGASAILMVAAACGTTTSNAPVNNNSATPGAGSASVSGPVGVAKTSLGTVLVDSKGMTVYMLTADTKGHSTCAGKCLQFWPLVPAPAGASVPSVQGVSAALATTKATSGAAMLTAGGWPLYTFLKDKAPGDVNGQGIKNFGGTWYAVSPSGAPVMAPAGAPATSSGGGGGGYGY